MVGHAQTENQGIVGTEIVGWRGNGRSQIQSKVETQKAQRLTFQKNYFTLGNPCPKT